MNSTAAKYLIVAGIFLILLGVAVYFLGDKLNWFGRLPGDIRVQHGATRFYFPIVTMILVSIVLTVIINIIRKLF